MSAFAAGFIAGSLALAVPPPAPQACAPAHAAMGHCTAGPAPTGRVAPTAAEPTYADRIWGAEAMRPARARLRREHGGGRFSQVMIDLAELQVRDGREGYRWEGEGWFGGDIHRLVVRSEGEGSLADGVDDADLQALYSRAIGPYFNFQAGLRQDIRPRPGRTYLAVGVDGLAPYWFELEAHGFLSNNGDVLGRLTASYDQRITQRLILQPRGELNLALQNGRDTDAGVTDIELGLRLRYELRREFAPYVGLSWERGFGGSGRLPGANGEQGGLGVVAGIRTWF